MILFSQGYRQMNESIKKTLWQLWLTRIVEKYPQYSHYTYEQFKLARLKCAWMGKGRLVTTNTIGFYYNGVFHFPIENEIILGDSFYHIGASKYTVEVME
jgi:hypothetical protein